MRYPRFDEVAGDRVPQEAQESPTTFCDRQDEACSPECPVRHASAEEFVAKPPCRTDNDNRESKRFGGGRDIATSIVTKEWF